MKNERTSRKVASIAGKVFERLKRCDKTTGVWAYAPNGDQVLIGSVPDVAAVIGTALTQAPDRVTVTSPALKKAKRTKGPQPGETVRTVKARKK